nr:MBL fold metallo-hydrolase [Clostridia bacterium]
YMSPEEEKLYRSNGGKEAVIPVSEGDVIDLGGRPLLIIDDPGHTPGSIAILDETNRVLYSGDSIQSGRIFMFGAHRDLKKYVESLEHLSVYDGRYDLVYPCHGKLPVYPDLVPQLIRGAKEILDGAAEGQTVDLFGNQVCLYQFPFAGFLCEMPSK